MPGLQRRTADLLSREAVRHLRYVPRIVARVRPWPAFLRTYMRLAEAPATYRLKRGGMRIRVRSGVDVSTIAVIFIKEDYGPRVEGEVVVDIGANIGVFALFAAAEPGTRVYAYEPVAATYAQLRESVELNGLEERVRTFNLAVTATVERRAIALNPSGSPFHSLYGGGETADIECVGLDRVFRDNDIERCDLLKLDCEGAEFEVLYGASEATLERVARICVEYHEQPAVDSRFRRDALLEHLNGRGFRVTRDRPGEPGNGTIWLDRR
jgi:FkbM family methyltransferase